MNHAAAFAFKNFPLITLFTLASWRAIVKALFLAGRTRAAVPTSNRRMNMKRFTLLFLVAVGVPLGTQSALAATWAVGTCKPSLPSYPSISAALSVPPPAGSTIEVCPGTYAEQPNITTPLTLEGISSANGGRAVIEIPPAGLTTSVSSIIPGVTVYPQVLVTATTGPVNIINITVDGTNNNLGGSADLAGIFYASGSSGTVDHITARYEIDGGDGAGIWAENGTSTSETVTIENCDIHDVDHWGIFFTSNQTPPTLDATVKGNDIEGGSVGPTRGIYSFGAAGIITSNVVADVPGYSIFGYGSTASILSNTISNTEANTDAGIVLLGSSEVVTGNAVTNSNGSSSSGILIYDPTATVENNKITNSGVAIEFACNSATVSVNTITDAATALDQVPASVGGANTYYGVDTIRTECAGSDASAKRAEIKTRLNRLGAIP
jgi:hypothetical protein